MPLGSLVACTEAAIPKCHARLLVSQDAIEGAREAVAELHRQLGIDPREMFSRLGIRAELGNYRPLDRAGANGAAQ